MIAGLGRSEKLSWAALDTKQGKSKNKSLLAQIFEGEKYFEI